MDVYDGLWFFEPVGPPSTTVVSPSTTACLSSPSSGYSSADEGRVTPVGETGWASPTDFILSSDPYLGELVMTPPTTTSLASRRPAATDAAAIPSTWSGSNLVLDEFVDTLWDSLASGVDVSPRSAVTGNTPAQC